MPETSRECVVCLLDETTFTVPVKSTLLGSELLDMAASHVNIKEREYFGLYTEGEGFKNWLELDKPVLDPSQDLPKGSQPVKIHFSFKYFIDDLRLLVDHMTVDLLYLQSRQAIMKGDISTDDDTIFELAACAMQSQFGEMRNDQEAKQQLNSFAIIPPHVFKRVSVSQCEDRVLYYYRLFRSLSRGDAIIKYLEIILSLPMYSMHYFEVKDKKEVSLWLGVGPDGICQCPYNNRNEPDCRFQWLQLQNIYYRDRKFSMEVYSSNKPSKKGMGFGPVVVYAWHGANSKIVMAIWKMARDQHMFYRSKRTNKNPHVGMNQTEIIRQLNKLHRTNISPSSSQSSLSLESAKSNQTQASAEAVAAAKAAQSEMYSALLIRRQSLMAEFEKKAARYKEILVKEMQITGIPPEGLTAEEIEKMRKKFGVSFKFSKFVLNDKTGSSDEVEQLERQLEVQSSIIKASKTLLEQANNRKLKKDRKKEIKKMEDKYQEIEQKLSDLKRNSRGSTMSGGTRFYGDSPGSVSVSRRRSGTPGGASIDDNFLASMIFDTPPKPSGSSNLQKSPHHKSTSALSDVQTSLPPSSKSTHLSSLSSYPGNPQGSKKAHTLAVTESSSYLSSIGGYADEFEELSPSSSIGSGANASFVSNHSTAGYQQQHHPQQHRGSGGYMGSPLAGRGLRDSDFADEIIHHYGGRMADWENHAHSPPRGSYVSPRKPDSAHRHEIPMASSPVTRYKRASSPTIGFPTESQQKFVVSHEGQGPRHVHATHPQEIQRSRSPDFYPMREGGYSSSYQPPSMMQQAAAAGYHKQTTPQNYQQQQQHLVGSRSSGGGNISPSFYTQSSGKGYPSHQQQLQNQHQQQVQERDREWPSDDPRRRLQYGEHGGVPPRSVNGNVANPSSSNAPVSSGQEKIPYRGLRKPSDQEMGLLEVLNMWDNSKKNPFGDGTLV